MDSTDQRSAEFLAVMLENAELRLALATAQDQCVELAIDAGGLHGEIEALRLRIAELEQDRTEYGAPARASRPGAVSSFARSPGSGF